MFSRCIHWTWAICGGLPGAHATSEKPVYKERYSFSLGRLGRISKLLIIIWKLIDICVFLPPLSSPFPLSSSPKWSKPTFQMLQIMKTAFPSRADPETESDWTSCQEKSEEKTKWAVPPQTRRWSASHGGLITVSVTKHHDPRHLGGGVSVLGCVGWSKKEVFRLHSHSRGTSLRGTELQTVLQKSSFIDCYTKDFFSKSISDFQNLLSDLEVVWRNRYLSQSQSLQGFQIFQECLMTEVLLRLWSFQGRATL